MADKIGVQLMADFQLPFWLSMPNTADRLIRFRLHSDFYPDPLFPNPPDSPNFGKPSYYNTLTAAYIGRMLLDSQHFAASTTIVHPARVASHFVANIGSHHRESLAHSPIAPIAVLTIAQSAEAPFRHDLAVESRD